MTAHPLHASWLADQPITAAQPVATPAAPITPLVPVARTGARDHHLDEFRARQHQRMRLAGWPIPLHRAGPAHAPDQDTHP